MAQQNTKIEKITRKSCRFEHEGDKPDYHASKRSRTVERSQERRVKVSSRCD